MLSNWKLSNMSKGLQQGVHMNRWKNAKIVIVENMKMAGSSENFRNFFKLEKFQLRKFENFKKQLLLFLTPSLSGITVDIQCLYFCYYIVDYYILV